MLPTATDEPFDALPPGSGLWWVSSFAALSASKNQVPGSDVRLGEITEDDDLRIELLVRRFLRNMLDKSDAALLDTLSHSMREHLSTQPIPVRTYFEHHFPSFKYTARVVSIAAYALAAQGLFVPVTVRYDRRSPVNVYFFLEQDTGGTWLIDGIRPGP